VLARLEADTGLIRCSSGSEAAADFVTGRMIARPFNGRLEGHGRIAGRCFDLRHGRKSQLLAILLMAFAPSQKP
jgi:hypothetical protein